jgi:hypothetical protein
VTGVAPLPAGAEAQQGGARYRADAGGDRVGRNRQPDRHTESSCRTTLPATAWGLGYGALLAAATVIVQGTHGHSTRAYPTCCRSSICRCSAA